MPSLQSASAIILLVLVAGTNPAHAAERGLCLTPEAMTQTLAAEGQRSIAHAQVVSGDRKRHGMIFTMSADRKVGYVLEADEPIGEPATKICVFERLQNLRLFDPRKPGTPPEVLIVTPDEQAKKVCADMRSKGETQGDTCQPLNQMIREGEQWGRRVLVRAENVSKQTNGSFQRDGSMTVIMGSIIRSENLPNKMEELTERVRANVWQVLLPEGAALRRLSMTQLTLTPHGEAVLDGRTQ